jgi:hypothetical protein
VVEEHHVVVHDAPVVVEEHIVPFPGRKLIDLHDLDNPNREIAACRSPIAAALWSVTSAT